MRDSTWQTRFSTWAFRCAFLTVLVAGAAVAPFRTAAQTAAAPANSGTAGQVPASQAPASQAQANDAAQPEAVNTQEDETNQFRHTALVKASAKALHLSVETMARIFELINFGIVALAIGIPLVRWLPKFLRKRAEKVGADIESARQVAEDANSRLSAVEAKLAHLDEEVERFRAEVEEEIRRDEAHIQSSLEEESARIIRAAEQEIGMAAAQAKRALRHFAADLAVDQAAKQLVLTPETDRALIAEFARDVAGNGGAGTGRARGGQN